MAIPITHLEEITLTFLGNHLIKEKFGRVIDKLDQHDQLFHVQNQAIQKLESQLGQLAATLTKSEEGQLSSQPVPNPKKTFQVDMQEQVQELHFDQESEYLTK